MLPLLFGIIVGFSLGLTGGGGSIFAVPLLVYGLAVPARGAVTISLAAVGVISLLGAIQRLRNGAVEVTTGLVFASAGMLGAPIGSWIAGRISPSLLLLMFAGLMLAVALRMWFGTKRGDPEDRGGHGRACQRDPSGRLIMTTPCVLLLGLVGIVTGVLAGLFGVGGGFVIVPALMVFSQMPIHRAIATSLLVIACVSVSGVTAHLLAGSAIDLDLTALFVAGGLGGMALGTTVATRLSGPRLQRLFAVAIVLVALFVIAKNLL